MKLRPTLFHLKDARWIPRIAGAYAALGGITCLMGWMLNIPRLADWRGFGISTQPNAALAATLAGIAIVLSTLGYRRTVAVLGGIVAAIGIATLIEISFSFDLGIDSALMFGRSWGREGTLAPGRMGFPSSTSWTITGISLLITARSAARRRWVPAMGLAISTVASLSLIGYLFDANTLYQLPRWTTIAWQTSTLLFAVGISLIALDSRFEPIRTLTSDSSAGLMARRALPFIICLPVLLGYFALRGHQIGFYDPAMAISVLVLMLILLISLVFWWGVRAVDEREQRLIRLEDARVRADIVLNAARDEFFVLDSIWHFEYVNDRVCQESGMPREQLLCRSFWSIWPELESSPLAMAARHVMKTRQVQTVEWFDTKRQRWFDSRIYPTEHGGIALFVLDITDRKMAVEALHRRMEELRTLLDTLPIGVFIALDRECKHISGNRAAHEMLRMAPERNLSKTAAEEEVPAHFRVCRKGVEIPPDQLPVQRAARGEYVRNEEVDDVFDDGTIIHTLMSAAPLLDEHGQSRGAVATVLDVTELKRAEEALRLQTNRIRTAEQELREVDRRKNIFLATLAHELRNPLAPIRNSLEVMKRSNGDSQLLRNSQATMDRQLAQLVRLVDDLLDVSRITSNKLELRRDNVQLADVIHHACESIKPLLEAASHRLSVEMPEQPIVLYADSMRLAQVLSNLLANACKYSDPNSEIHLAVALQEQSVVVTVRDNGIGIPPEKLEEVFQLFTQIDHSLERSRGGLGIGLSLVKRLVEMHGGSVIATSDGVGKGSAFSVELPTVTVPVVTAPTQDHKPREPNARGRRILVVDDNTDSATSLALLLQMTGNQTETANDGLDALDKIHAYRPEIVLLDIGLPKMNGYDVCREIRSLPWGQELKIIALTGWGQDDDRRRSHEAGFNGHLVKPVDFAALTELMDQCATKSHPGCN